MKSGEKGTRVLISNDVSHFRQTIRFSECMKLKKKIFWRASRMPRHNEYSLRVLCVIIRALCGRKMKIEPQSTQRFAQGTQRAFNSTKRSVEKELCEIFVIFVPFVVKILFYHEEHEGHKEAQREDFKTMISNTLMHNNRNLTIAALLTFCSFQL